MCYKVSQKLPLVKYKEYYDAIDILAEDEQSKTELFFQANGFAHPKLLVLSNDSGSGTLERMQWGLLPPSTWKYDWKKALIHSNNTLNAKSETIFEVKSFKDNILKNRCILPVEGFFEYKHVGKDKIPYFIHPKTHPFFNLACVYGNYQNPLTKEWVKSFSIVTGAANSLMAEIHNTKFRQPISLSNDQISAWLDDRSTPQDLELLMTPCDDSNMAAYPVRRDLQQAGNIPAVLEKVSYGLFD